MSVSFQSKPLTQVESFYCTRCDLHQNSKVNCIGGRGSEKPRILLIGMNPGWKEEKLGQPFVGPSGQLLSELLREAKISETAVRFTNAVRCVNRIPDSKSKFGKLVPPEQKHIDACSIFIMTEIEHYKPSVIVCLGELSSIAIIGKKGAVKSLRGKSHTFEFPKSYLRDRKNNGVDISVLSQVRIPTIVTYHPSYLLRSEKGKNKDSDRGLVVSDFVYTRKLAYGEKDDDSNYTLLTNIDMIEQFAAGVIEQYKRGAVPYIASDIETAGGFEEPDGGLKPFNPDGSIVTVQICWGKDQAVCIPIDHPESPFRDTISISRIRKALNDIYTTIPSVWQNGTFDIKWLRSKFNIEFTDKIFFDTFTAHQCLYMKTRPNDLDFLATNYLGIVGYSNELKESLKNLPKKNRSFKNLKLDMVHRYGCGDVNATFQLVPILKKKLEEKKLSSFYDEFFRRASFVVADIETSGIKLDMQMYSQLKKEFPAKIDSLVSDLYTSHFVRSFMAKERNCPPEFLDRAQSRTLPPKIQDKFGFNLSSAEQKAIFVYKTMGLPNPFPEKKVNDSGYASTDADFLKQLRDMTYAAEMTEEHRILEIMLAYNKISKLNSSYIKNIFNVIQRVDPKERSLFFPFVRGDCRKCYYVNPTYKMEGTRTGRFSASEPAIHNIPRESDVKKLFISRWRDYGGLWFAMDYSQVEVRILALASQDENLMKIVCSGGDTHRSVANFLYGTPIEEVTAKQRSGAKNTNFAVIYGASDEKIARMSSISLAEAADFRRRYLGMFDGVDAWKKQQEKNADILEGVTTIFGRWCPIPVSSYETEGGRASRHRKAVNTPIQSAASDLTLTSLIRIYHRLKRENLKSLVILFKHDEIAFDVYPGELFRVKRIAQEEMELRPKEYYPILSGIPLKTSSEVGISWGGLCDFSLNDDGTWRFAGTKQKTLASLHQLKVSGFEFQIENRNDDDTQIDISLKNEFVDVKVPELSFISEVDNPLEKLYSS